MSLSTSAILDAAVEMVARKHLQFPCEHLDIGSGHGDLIGLLRNRFDLHSSACDYTDTLMELEDVKVGVADLNREGLPFASESFDLVTCTEVVEHLEHYRETLREMHRVLKPGGTLVLSTPNILNLKSRIRFLFFGFYNLFGPLHVRESELHLSGGHINPVSSFYLSHSLLDAGFVEIDLAIDKVQGTSRFWHFFLGLPIRIASAMALKREKEQFHTVDEHNERFVMQMNSRDVLLGRTIVIGCKKP
ncbi:MAG: class I SAM-dependent methyltransferase [Burkholderiales bacterium]|nr:class I SAM-dependent methyltransferase [Burkholderiales bacterium]